MIFLRQGFFGVVSEARYKEMPVAIKSCRLQTKKDETIFFNEGRLMLKYNHPNVVTCFGIAAQSSPIFIVMEYMKGNVKMFKYEFNVKIIEFDLSKEMSYEFYKQTKIYQ